MTFALPLLTGILPAGTSAAHRLIWSGFFLMAAGIYLAERRKPHRIYYQFQALLLHCVFYIVNALSVSSVARLAEGIGSLLFMRKRRKQYSVDNLRRAFPRKSEADIKKIGLASMQSMVKVIFEFMQIPTIARKPDQYIEVRGEENVWGALEKGAGAIWVVAHFGNWELAGIAGCSKGFPIYAIGKTYKNPLINDFVRRLRGLTGLRTINQKGAVRKSVQLLKSNNIVAMLIDERANKGAVWADLFGQKAATSALPAMLALKYRVPVIPMFYYREKNKRARMVLGKPFALIETGDYDADILSNTQQYVTLLEKELMKRPEDWTLWMHNRWRWKDRAA